METLTWSRWAGLGIDRTVIDWSGFGRKELGAVAFGPDRAVTVAHWRSSWRVLVSPPTGTFVDPPRHGVSRCPERDDHASAGLGLAAVPLLRCFGGRTLSFDAWVPGAFGKGGICTLGRPHDWLVCSAGVLMLGPGPGADYFLVHGHPGGSHRGARLMEDVGARLRITGHFDDPAAARCPAGRPYRGAIPYRLDCRRSFVVTDVRRVRRP